MRAIRGLRRLCRRVPVAGWLCALVGFLNVSVWAIVTPPFQVPDENSHVAYVQNLAENGRPPSRPGGSVYATEETRVLIGLQFNEVVGRPDHHPIWSALEDARIDGLEDSGFPRADGGGITAAAGQPPLFYGISAVAYQLSPWRTLLARVALMRAVAALLAALTVLFVFLFLRECFAQEWIWSVGALAVAFQPQFGFSSGGVNPDALLFASSAALFFGLALAFRRGLTRSRALFLGAVLAAGVLSKLTFLVFLPGILVALGVLIHRSSRRGLTARLAGISLAVFAAFAMAYAMLNTFAWDRSALGGGIEAAARTSANTQVGATEITIGDRLGYTWQLYLPRLPIMEDEFEAFPLRETWLDGAVGNFGWIDTVFPAWAYTVGLWIAIAVLVLASVTLFRRRDVLRSRWPELLAYGVLVLGLLASIGWSGIRYREDTGLPFEQARYLFPLLALYAAVICCAALGAGRRAARTVGALLVILALVHGVLGQLLVIGRFYG